MARRLKCGVCGSNFICRGFNPLKPCWCTKINLSNKDRVRIRKTAADCVCNGCLSRSA
ncbi:MAG: cysteine-rich CWC family protein [Candidatus Micrarchaeaceae archaeon]